MFNREQAKKLGPLVNNHKAWQALEEHLQELTHKTSQELVVEQSEQVLRQLQGKMVLLGHLLNLKKSVLATVQSKIDDNKHKRSEGIGFGPNSRTS